MKQQLLFVSKHNELFLGVFLSNNPWMKPSTVGVTKNYTIFPPARLHQPLHSIACEVHFIARMHTVHLHTQCPRSLSVFMLCVYVCVVSAWAVMTWRNLNQKHQTMCEMARDQRAAGLKWVMLYQPSVLIIPTHTRVKLRSFLFSFNQMPLSFLPPLQTRTEAVGYTLLKSSRPQT